MSERRGFFDVDPKDRSRPRPGGPDRGSAPSESEDRPRDQTRDRPHDRPQKTVEVRTGGPRRQEPSRSSGRSETRRSFGRWLVVLLWWGVQAALAVVVGVLIFDRVLMPRFVEQGAEVEIPRVHGIAVSDAKTILEQAGLEPVVADGRFSQIADNGTILESSPGPGLLVKLGRKVFLTPSLGTESRTVPELQSLSLRLASRRLQVAGLDVGSVDYTATDEVPPGVVLASIPPSGSPVRGAGEVSLLMSRARRAVPFWMPSLVGRTGIETAAWLEACGFEVDLTESSYPGAPGEVLRHEPRAGEPIYSGDRVELVIARSGGGDGFDQKRPWD